MISFGPDGYLYLGFGDGGSGGDPGDRAQKMMEYLGKCCELMSMMGIRMPFLPPTLFTRSLRRWVEIWG